jgi:hypothetical protein
MKRLIKKYQVVFVVQPRVPAKFSFERRQRHLKKSRLLRDVPAEHLRYIDGIDRDTQARQRERGLSEPSAVLQ